MNVEQLLKAKGSEPIVIGPKQTIEATARLLPLDIPTIEIAGGSVRCMLAGIHLSRRPVKGPTS